MLCCVAVPVTLRVCDRLGVGAGLDVVVCVELTLWLEVVVCVGLAIWDSVGDSEWDCVCVVDWERVPLGLCVWLNVYPRDIVCVGVGVSDGAHRLDEEL